MAQIAATHWDASKPPTFVGKLVGDHLKAAEEGRESIRDHADGATEAELRPLLRAVDAKLEIARLIGDGVVSAFFHADKPKERIKRLVEFQKAVQSNLGSSNLVNAVAPFAATLIIDDHPVKPFHWQVEFPEVFAGERGGFDAVVGNPPFLGGSRISSEIGSKYLQYLLSLFPTAGDKTDLVLYFFARAFQLLRTNGAAGLVATNTVAQGDSRSTLRILKSSGFHIYRAIRRLPWPGDATVVVSILHLSKGSDAQLKFIDGHQCSRISVYLKANDIEDDPETLSANAGLAYEGFGPYGSGFIIHEASAELAALQRVPENDAIIFDYVGGEDILNDPRGKSDRKIIYTGKMDRAEFERSYPIAYEIVERTVRAERAKKSKRVASMPWWQFLWPRPELKNKMNGLGSVIVRPRVASHHAFMCVSSDKIVSNSANVICSESMALFAALQSRPHEMWARFFSSSMKDDLRYTPSDCFRTFPFPVSFETDTTLDEAGQAYHVYRANLMIERNEGLTKTYNRFHSRGENSSDIARLRALHAAMDAAVLRAYGWGDLADRAAPEFIEQEVDEGKKAKTRLDWPGEFKDEVLARLLALNAERAAAERAAGVTSTSDDENEEIDEEVDA